MHKFKRTLLFKSISLLVVVSFLATDIARADPSLFNPSSDKLAAQSMFQSSMMTEAAAKFRESGIADANFTASVLGIGEYLLGDPAEKEKPLPLEHLEAVMRRELGGALTGIDVGRVSKEGDVVTIPCEIRGDKSVIKIVLKEGLSAQELAGYDLIISDRYVVKVVTEETKDKGERIKEKTSADYGLRGTETDTSDHHFRFSKAVWNEFQSNLAKHKNGAKFISMVKSRGLAWTDAAGKRHYIDEAFIAEEDSNFIWTAAMRALNTINGYVGKGKRPILKIAQVKAVVDYHEKIHELLKKDPISLRMFKAELQSKLGDYFPKFITAFKEAYGEHGQSQSADDWYMEEFLTLTIQEQTIFGNNDVVFENMKKALEFKRDNGTAGSDTDLSAVGIESIIKSLWIISIKAGEAVSAVRHTENFARLSAELNRGFAEARGKKQEVRKFGAPGQHFRFGKVVWKEFKKNLGKDAKGKELVEIVGRRGLAWTDAKGRRHYVDEALSGSDAEFVWNAAVKALNTVNGWPPSDSKYIKHASQVKAVIDYHENVHKLLKNKKYQPLIGELKKALKLEFGEEGFRRFIVAFEEAYGKPSGQELEARTEEDWYIEEFLTLTIQEKEIFEDRDKVLNNMTDAMELKIRRCPESPKEAINALRLVKGFLIYKKADIKATVDRVVMQSETFQQLRKELNKGLKEARGKKQEARKTDTGASDTGTTILKAVVFLVMVPAVAFSATGIETASSYFWPMIAALAGSFSGFIAGEIATESLKEPDYLSSPVYHLFYAINSFRPAGLRVLLLVAGISAVIGGSVSLSAIDGLLFGVSAYLAADNRRSSEKIMNGLDIPRREKSAIRKEAEALGLVKIRTMRRDDFPTEFVKVIADRFQKEDNPYVRRYMARLASDFADISCVEYLDAMDASEVKRSGSDRIVTRMLDSTLDMLEKDREIMERRLKILSKDKGETPGARRQTPGVTKNEERTTPGETGEHPFSMKSAVWAGLAAVTISGAGVVSASYFAWQMLTKSFFGGSDMIFLGASLAASIYFLWTLERFERIAGAIDKAFKKYYEEYPDRDKFPDRGRPTPLEIIKMDIADSSGFRHPAFYLLPDKIIRFITIHEAFNSHRKGILAMFPVASLFMAKRYYESVNKAALYIKAFSDNPEHLYDALLSGDPEINSIVAEMVRNINDPHALMRMYGALSWDSPAGREVVRKLLSLRDPAITRKIRIDIAAYWASVPGRTDLEKPIRVSLGITLKFAGYINEPEDVFVVQGLINDYVTMEKLGQNGLAELARISGSLAAVKKIISIRKKHRIGVDIRKMFDEYTFNNGLDKQAAHKWPLSEEKIAKIIRMLSSVTANSSDLDDTYEVMREAVGVVDIPLHSEFKVYCVDKELEEAVEKRRKALTGEGTKSVLSVSSDRILELYSDGDLRRKVSRDAIIGSAIGDKMGLSDKEGEILKYALLLEGLGLDIRSTLSPIFERTRDVVRKAHNSVEGGSVSLDDAAMRIATDHPSMIFPSDPLTKEDTFTSFKNILKIAFANALAPEEKDVAYSILDAPDSAINMLADLGITVPKDLEYLLRSRADQGKLAAYLKEDPSQLNVTPDRLKVIFSVIQVVGMFEFPDKSHGKIDMRLRRRPNAADFTEKRYIVEEKLRQDKLPAVESILSALEAVHEKYRQKVIEAKLDMKGPAHAFKVSSGTDGALISMASAVGFLEIAGILGFMVLSGVPVARDVIAIGGFFLAGVYASWATVRFTLVSRAVRFAFEKYYREQGLEEDVIGMDIARNDGYRHPAFDILKVDAPFAARLIDIHENFKSHFTGMLALLPLVSGWLTTPEEKLRYIARSEWKKKMDDFSYERVKSGTIFLSAPPAFEDFWNAAVKPLVYSGIDDVTVGKLIERAFSAMVEKKEMTQIGAKKVQTAYRADIEKAREVTAKFMLERMGPKETVHMPSGEEKDTGESNVEPAKKNEEASTIVGIAQSPEKTRERVETELGPSAVAGTTKNEEAASVDQMSGTQEDETFFNSRRRRLIESTNEITDFLQWLQKTGTKYEKLVWDDPDAKIRQQATAAIGGIDKMRGMPGLWGEDLYLIDKLSVADAYLRENLERLEVDSMVAAIIILARRAKEDGKNIMIGLETDWIPGNTQGNLQHTAINPLIREIDSLGNTLKDLGLTNVTIVHRSAKDLASALMDEAQKTSTDLSNIIVLASKNTVNADAFSSLRSTEREKRAFIAAVDPSEINKISPESEEQCLIRITEMLSLTLEFALGKDVSRILAIKDALGISEYDPARRLLVFLPRPEPVSYETMRNIYMAKLKALQAA